jgi:hypothetical protein
MQCWDVAVADHFEGHGGVFALLEVDGCVSWTAGAWAGARTKTMGASLSASFGFEEPVEWHGLWYEHSNLLCSNNRWLLWCVHTWTAMSRCHWSMHIEKCAVQVVLYSFWSIFQPRSEKNLRPLADTPPLPRLVRDSRSATPLCWISYSFSVNTPFGHRNNPSKVISFIRKTGGHNIFILAQRYTTHYISI